MQGLKDRCHRIYQAKPKNPADQTPADIIVKFVSYKTKAKLLTKEPMENPRTDNNSKNEKERVYVRKDLSNSRGNVLYKALEMKKAGLVKDAFSRDGNFTIRRPANKSHLKNINYRISNEDELKHSV